MRRLLSTIHWAICSRLIGRSRLLDLRTSDWLVATRPCGCIAGAVAAKASEESILEFARDCEREGLTVTPHRGDVGMIHCKQHDGTRG